MHFIVLLRSYSISVSRTIFSIVLTSYKVQVRVGLIRVVSHACENCYALAKAKYSIR